ncbi:hypothetical protein F4806DRAFT_194298 [Annulohypoxylon nitens]|nr:hypothetical protein F4806DRAFT_194298 [Annulohypoxylon nitens]
MLAWFVSFRFSTQVVSQAFALSHKVGQSGYSVCYCTPHQIFSRFLKGIIKSEQRAKMNGKISRQFVNPRSKSLISVEGERWTGSEAKKEVDKLTVYYLIGS